MGVKLAPGAMVAEHGGTRVTGFIKAALARCLVAIAIIATGTATPAVAEDPPFFALGAGFYDINDNEEAAEFRAEYRAAGKLWIFKPFGGLMTTTDAAVYGYGGFLVDVYFGNRVVLTPSLAAGAYSDGNGKDLGHTIEFRSALELSYRFDDRSRLGLMFYHLSNASLDDNNPGTEILSLTYAIPLSGLAP